MFNAINGSVALGDGTADYVAFGEGERTLIMIPGLGDGLKTVKGMARPFSVMYRKLARKFRVYVFSRRNRLPDGYSSRDMAADLVAEMDALGIERASIVGISQGGTIAQYIALDHPERVERLILTVTYGRVNPTIESVITKWLEYASARDYASIVTETGELSYSEKYLAKMRRFYPLLTKLPIGVDFDRFTVQAKACLSHDALDSLGKISAPTLIIGGRLDKIVTPQASEELHSAIPNSSLFFYDALGHALYEEASDFHDRIIGFCTDDC